MSRRRSRLARWSALLLAYLVVPLAALATLEVCLRLGGALRPTTFFVAAPDRPGSEDAVATNPLFGYTWFPASYAIRPAPRRVARAPGDETLRVAVVGGSAAFGDLAPRFGLSRVLEVVLAGATDRPVEVVNAALAGVNSHVVRRIVDDVLDLRPDAVVIYLGHNEVVGPWGPGAVAERGDPDDRPPPLATIRRVEALRTLRLAQALGRLSPRVGAPDAASARPAADEIAALEVPLGDPRLERVEAHLEANLRAMVRAVRRAGAIALVVAPASNLRDFAPFASTVPDGAAGEAVRRGLEAMFDAAEAGDCDRLFALADELGAAGAETADAVWLRGRCLLRDGELEAARDALRRARDLDAQRYRADSRLRAAILEIADDEGARVLDGAELLADADGLAGADSFYDHVHLTFEGNRRLAVGIAQRLASEAAAASGFEAERLDPERLDPSPADLQRALA
ncbi:MAG: SGNH/GDSL hydrolase family protein, partial [Acidobacteriota bacterium]